MTLQQEKSEKSLEDKIKMSIFGVSEMTIRVIFPREGKALSILPILKELLGAALLLYIFSNEIFEEGGTVYSLFPKHGNALRSNLSRLSGNNGKA